MKYQQQQKVSSEVVSSKHGKNYYVALWYTCAGERKCVKLKSIFSLNTIGTIKQNNQLYIL